MHFDPTEGTLTIGGQNVVIDTVDTVQIGTTVANTLKNDSNFTGVIINSVGTQVKGKLNTDDLSVGNGSCFFKGDNNSASTSHCAQYTVGSAGAGHLANGNIKWTNTGSVSVKGNIEADSMTIKAAAYADIDNTAGKMWFTNYGSAKSISHGVI